MLCVTYAVMILHELAHCLAAVCIGLKISHIDFYPFGVNLKLKNKFVYSLADEIIFQRAALQYYFCTCLDDCVQPLSE